MTLFAPAHQLCCESLHKATCGGGNKSNPPELSYWAAPNEFRHGGQHVKSRSLHPVLRRSALSASRTRDAASAAAARYSTSSSPKSRPAAASPWPTPAAPKTHGRLRRSFSKSSANTITWLHRREAVCPWCATITRNGWKESRDSTTCAPTPLNFANTSWMSPG